MLRQAAPRRTAIARLFGGSVVLLACLAAGAGDNEQGSKSGDDPPSGVHGFTVRDIDGKPVKLADFSGDVLLIVNVASECGLTVSNYERLGPLHARYRDRGFRILAFPANNFGGQEPGTNEEIKSFCKRYNVKYDLFAKVSVKGEDICPLYKYLTEQTGEKTRGAVKWNFQKYLVGRDGTVLAKFSPRVAPDDPKLVEAVEQALKAPRPAKSG